MKKIFHKFSLVIIVLFIGCNQDAKEDGFKENMNELINKKSHVKRGFFNLYLDNLTKFQQTIHRLFCSLLQVYFLLNL